MTSVILEEKTIEKNLHIVSRKYRAEVEDDEEGEEKEEQPERKDRRKEVGGRRLMNGTTASARDVVPLP